MSRAKMPPQERQLRSRLAQLVHNAPFMRAGLTLRKVTCGKDTCRCAKGERHLALYATCRIDGKPRQVFVPKHLEQEVRQWVANYQEILEKLDGVSEQAWEQLKERKKKGKAGS
jgi:hypothetical protein